MEVAREKYIVPVERLVFKRLKSRPDSSIGLTRAQGLQTSDTSHLKAFAECYAEPSSKAEDDLSQDRRSRPEAAGTC